MYWVREYERLTKKIQLQARHLYYKKQKKKKVGGNELPSRFSPAQTQVASILWISLWQPRHNALPSS